MNWTEVDIFTSTEGIEPLSAVLMEIGITGFAVKDAKDFEFFLNDKNGNWDYIDDDLMGLKDCETTLTVYLPDNSQGLDMLNSIKNELIRLKSTDINNEYGRLELSMRNVKEEDWANNWKKYFKPFNVGKHLLVKPSWEECENTDNRKILEIDPASSFGTGQHHTTRLCLELLEKYIKSGDKLLDIGTGSGILFIASILLGAKNAYAVDIEENSIRIAKENAEKNNISSDIFTAVQGNIISDEALVQKIGKSYDIITANIVADVIIAMGGIFPEFLKEKGILIISGIITERIDEVLKSLENSGFKVLEVYEKEGWNAAALTR